MSKFVRRQMRTALEQLATDGIDESILNLPDEQIDNELIVQQDSFDAAQDQVAEDMEIVNDNDEVIESLEALKISILKRNNVSIEELGTIKVAALGIIRAQNTNPTIIESAVSIEEAVAAIDKEQEARVSDSIQRVSGIWNGIKTQLSSVRNMVYLNKKKIAKTKARIQALPSNVKVTLQIPLNRYMVSPDYDVPTTAKEYIKQMSESGDIVIGSVTAGAQLARDDLGGIIKNLLKTMSIVAYNDSIKKQYAIYETTAAAISKVTTAHRATNDDMKVISAYIDEDDTHDAEYIATNTALGGFKAFVSMPKHKPDMTDINSVKSAWRVLDIYTITHNKTAHPDDMTFKDMTKQEALAIIDIADRHMTDIQNSRSLTTILSSLGAAVNIGLVPNMVSNTITNTSLLSGLGYAKAARDVAISGAVTTAAVITARMLLLPLRMNYEISWTIAQLLINTKKHAESTLSSAIHIADQVEIAMSRASKQ